jgi:hypothetical protein
MGRALWGSVSVDGLWGLVRDGVDLVAAAVNASGPRQSLARCAVMLPGAQALTVARHADGRAVCLQLTTDRHEGNAMTTVMIFHEVDDVDHWLRSPKREEFFGPIGMTVRTFVDPDKTNRVGLIVTVPDLDTLRTALATEAAADAMKFDGVRPETIVMLVES